MNIREVETQTGLKKANIRYYEQEGLLTPKRNEKNNYREYDAADIQVLKKIKFLRTLEVPLQDIKKYQEGKAELSIIMDNRLSVIETELEHLTESYTLCKMMKENNPNFEDIDITVIDLNNYFFKKKGGNVMRMDRVWKMENKIRNVRYLMCGLSLVFSFVHFGERMLGETISNLLVGLTALLITILLGIWCYLSDRLSDYKQEQ